MQYPDACLCDLPHLGAIVTYEITLTLWCGNSWVMSWGFTISYTCMLEKHKTKARKIGKETFREWIGCGTMWRNPCTFYSPCDRGICFHKPNCNHQTWFLLRGAVLYGSRGIDWVWAVTLFIWGLRTSRRTAKWNTYMIHKCFMAFYKLRSPFCTYVVEMSIDVKKKIMLTFIVCQHV